MRLDYSKKFIKQFKKAPIKIQRQWNNRLAIFIKDKFHPVLDNHSLKGRFIGCNSIDINGDWRAIFTEEDNYSLVKFYAIGTHSQLYG